MDVNGVSVTIDSQVFVGYSQESYRILSDIVDLNTEFKYLVETISETTKLEKKDVSKYLKARFKESTKEPKKQAELFESLDAVLEG
jgi:hypothetical protein